MNFQVSSLQTKERSRGAQYLTQISGAFYGDALSNIDLDRIMYHHWIPKWIEKERRMIRRTWFDHRHCHPVLRSFFFFNEYTLAYQRAYRRFWDSNQNLTNLRPYKKTRNLYQLNKGAIVHIINTMHFVDESRLPYDVFFDAAIEHFMQKREYVTVWAKKPGLKGSKLPPINVLKDGEALIAAQTKFDRRNLTRLRLVQHPLYVAEKWAAQPTQREYVSYLFREVRRRKIHPKHPLKSLVYDLGVVREHEVARKFGLDMVKEIRSIRDC